MSMVMVSDLYLKEVFCEVIVGRMKLIRVGFYFLRCII